jgi:hypothetical protein
VCVPTEFVAEKSTAADGVGRGGTMEVALATAAPSRCATTAQLKPGLSGVFCIAAAADDEDHTAGRP